MDAVEALKPRPVFVFREKKGTYVKLDNGLVHECWAWIYVQDNVPVREALVALASNVLISAIGQGGDVSAKSIKYAEETLARLKAKVLDDRAQEEAVRYAVERTDW